MMPWVVVGLLIFLPDFFVAGSCVNDICDWEPWESWDSCSQTCGGGYKMRTRALCCRSDIGFDKCVEECGLDSDDSSSYSSCNTHCSRGGSFKYNHYDIRNYRYYYGSCRCPQAYTGTCCGSGMYTDQTIYFALTGCHRKHDTL